MVSLGAAANNSDAEAGAAEALPEGGTLGLAQVEEQTQIDEIFNALDDETRTAFQRWQQNAAVAIRGRSLDLSDSLGNFGPFLTDASDVLALLRRQRTQLQGLVRDTGTVFDALSERDGQLATAITGSNETFDALAAEEAALRDLFQVAPTFENEATLTFNRLDEFQRNTRPLVQDLLPVANDISPTLRSVRQLSPNLQVAVPRPRLPDARLAQGLPGPLEHARGPAAGARQPRPVPRPARAGRLLAEPLPDSVTDFLQGPRGRRFRHAERASRARRRPSTPCVSSATSRRSRSRSIRTACPTNRGNGYLFPFDQLIEKGEAAREGIFPNFDCDNTGGGVRRFSDGGDPEVGASFAPCILSEDFPAEFGRRQGPAGHARSLTRSVHSHGVLPGRAGALRHGRAPVRRRSPAPTTSSRPRCGPRTRSCATSTRAPTP